MQRIFIHVKEKRMLNLLTIVSITYIACCIFNYVYLKNKTIKTMKEKNKEFVLDVFIAAIIKNPQLTLTIIRDWYVTANEYVKDVKFSIKHKELTDAVTKNLQENGITLESDWKFTIVSILFTPFDFNMISSTIKNIYIKVKNCLPKNFYPKIHLYI